MNTLITKQSVAVIFAAVMLATIGGVHAQYYPEFFTGEDYFQMPGTMVHSAEHGLAIEQSYLGVTLNTDLIMGGFAAQSGLTGKDVHLFSLYTTPVYTGEQTWGKFGAMAVNDYDGFSSAQKAGFNSLFSHVYSTFGSDVLGGSGNTAAALAFQVALWEITWETTGTWGITNGDTQFIPYTSSLWHMLFPSDDVNPDMELYNETLALADFWIAAIQDDSLWGPEYTMSAYDLTLYRNDMGPGYGTGLLYIGVEPSSSVPEPATLAVVGLGLVGLGMARRRSK